MLCQNKTLNKKPLAKNEPQSVKKCLYTRMHEIIYAHTSVHKFFLKKKCTYSNRKTAQLQRKTRLEIATRVFKTNQEYHEK